MKLQDIIQTVKEDKLDNTQLENYYGAVSVFSAELLDEIASLEKNEALYMDSKAREESVASRKVSWKATTEGQRLIVLKRYNEATKTLLRSIKSRILSRL